ncbi:hypothetical protein A2867_01825 [Candidatus Daviesbacteria bacterium RIFCSPHIGHO2_01_FULL_40_11]|uniref:DUF5666 domain-containing protein n=1 Tax=Candidatus Daviesbacteria bacterium RIFCSPHIGHO2_01_FULL_40_11 TaxID=1797762 RepID=A0A1F5JGM6_9BACT|nr:MAG: hypothetical protein A2867_01825 [Candidatus Daviesbacteria bacterium RIFCSPHIGHO2_01_FULL_40_11]
MRKLLVISSSFIVILIAIAIFLRTTNYELRTVYAANSTPSADIKAKLEELKKEIASKAAKLKQEIGRRLTNKAYVGKVQSKSDTTLTLAADSGPKMVTINQDTVYESKVKGKTKFSQKSLAEDDYISALGDSDETGVLIAKKIILLPTTNYQPKTYLWGQIISISDKLITLKDRDFKVVAVSLPSGSKVSLNDFVILTGNKNKNDIFAAGFVYVIPQGGILKPKKVATPAAQTTTKSATPAAKKK